MGKSTSVKREIRFQQWIQQVKEYNERPDGMSMSAWCKTRGIAQSTFATRLQKVQDRCLESYQTCSGRTTLYPFFLDSIMYSISFLASSSASAAVSYIAE